MKVEQLTGDKSDSTLLEHTVVRSRFKVIINQPVAFHALLTSKWSHSLQNSGVGDCTLTRHGPDPVAAWA